MLISVHVLITLGITKSDKKTVKCIRNQTRLNDIIYEKRNKVERIGYTVVREDGRWLLRLLGRLEEV